MEGCGGKYYGWLGGDIFWKKGRSSDGLVNTT